MIVNVCKSKCNLWPMGTKILPRPRPYKNLVVWWSHTRVSRALREVPFEFFVGMRPRRGLKLESCFGLCWLPDLVNDGACLRLDMWGSFVSESKPPNMRFLKKLRLWPSSPEFQQRPTSLIWNPGLWRLQWSHWGRKRRRRRRNPWRLRSRCRRFWPHLWPSRGSRTSATGFHNYWRQNRWNSGIDYWMVQSIRISLFQEFKSHYTDKFLILLLKKRKFLRIYATNSVYDSGDWCKHDHDRVYGSRERRVNLFPNDWWLCLHLNPVS